MALCCQDPDHIVNFSRSTYATDMVGSLAVVPEAIRKVAGDFNNYNVASFEKCLAGEMAPTMRP